MMLLIAEVVKFVTLKMYWHVKNYTEE